jgi:hypothetical protein
MADQQLRDTPTATANSSPSFLTDSPPAAAPAAPSSPAPQAELIPAEDPEVRCTLPNLSYIKRQTCRSNNH